MGIMGWVEGVLELITGPYLGRCKKRYVYQVR